jgi:hypothetical protein
MFRTTTNATRLLAVGGNPPARRDHDPSNLVDAAVERNNYDGFAAQDNLADANLVVFVFHGNVFAGAAIRRGS